MTKKLSTEEKKRRKEERRKSNQQKPKSPTVKTVTVPKPEEATNLCDSCAYEFGECEGQPTFASDQDESLKGTEADRVIKCPAFVNVAVMPTAEELKKKEAAAPGPAAAEGEGKSPTPWEIALGKLDKFGQAQLNARADEIRELAEAEIALKFGPDASPTNEQLADVLVGIVQETIKREGGPTDGLRKEEAVAEEEDGLELAQEPIYVPAPPQARPDPKRFLKPQDFGNCPSCLRPLKRTAFNRYNDAVRCTNPRCRAYRTVVKTLSTGVK